ncbi:MAG: sigma 54-interacting transcriptional regulator [Syntrophomonas sp.]
MIGIKEYTEKSPGKMSTHEIISKSLQLSGSLNINPEAALENFVLDQSEIENRKRENLDLGYIVEYLEEILNSTEALNYPLIITDHTGCVLFISGTRNPIGTLSEGTRLDTEVIGTNAIGLAVKNRIPIKVEGKDHFLRVLANNITFACPIIYGDKLIGGIGFICRGRDKLQAGIMENIIISSLHAIYKMLEARKHLDELYLLKNFFAQLDNDRGILVANADSKIIQVNREAEIILGISKAELINHHLQDLTGEPGSSVDEKYHNCKLTLHTGRGKTTVMASLEPVLAQDGRVIGQCMNIFVAQAENCDGNSTRLPNRFEFKDIVGQNHDFMRTLRLAHAIARSPSNVLITGESGTGKELFAQAVHYASNYSNKPFIAINCAAIPQELIETELFGYAEGAFTGARKGGMQGKFVQANGGTLFLDEIGDMPIQLQPKLLRVLQERMVVPVGGGKAFPINIRIISATNQNIEELIADKKFRADLYYRLNVINLRIPPLRERKDDILLLADHFVKVYNRKLNRQVSSISDEASQCLLDYNWPGNIRELENAVESGVNLADSIIDVEHLGSNINRSKTYINSMEEAGIMPLEQSEKIQITQALISLQGNITQTANALQIGRSTLYRKIKKYNLLSYVKQQ